MPRHLYHRFTPGWQINREELAWAAGFFDGEGCIQFRMKKGSKGTAFRNVSIAMPQTDPQVLHRFKKAVGGLGMVNGPYGPYRTTFKESPIWQYQAGSFNEVQTIVGLLWRFLSPVKQQQIWVATSAYLRSG